MAAGVVHGVSVSARRGVRRSAPEVTAELKKALPRQDALNALLVPDLRRRAIAGCRAVTWDGVALRTAPIGALRTADHAQLRPVRRLGSFPQARSNLMVHATRFAGIGPCAVWAESKTEWLRLVELDRLPDLHWYSTQACLLTWPIGDRAIVQIPDIVVRREDSTSILSVKADTSMSDYNREILDGLLPQTCDAHDIGYTLLGEPHHQHALNLRLLARLRWRPNVVEEPWWPEVDKVRPKTLGALAERCGTGPQGRARALAVLAQCLADTDLTRQLRAGTVLAWR